MTPLFQIWWVCCGPTCSKTVWLCNQGWIDPLLRCVLIVLHLVSRWDHLGACRAVVCSPQLASYSRLWHPFFQLLWVSHSTFTLSVCLQASGDHFHQHWYGRYQEVSNLFVARPHPLHPPHVTRDECSHFWPALLLPCVIVNASLRILPGNVEFFVPRI